ncbi:hydrogenase expression/formation protein HypE [Spirulina subsalsa]|uniref:hydrogenase expression/formation protein HypE n=1 Tax=Spirulina subsalsa TaxID=54311 RepID=UPI00030ADE1D|nr:hydrogenase expression/formation protein HypE [Spirulina subsalsa]
MSDFNLSCPIPLDQYPQVLLAHGGGGKLMNQLIEQMFAPTFQATTPPHDSIRLNLPGEKIAFTTDSYVIRPLFFPGGDIGSLAIHGTVNDLAMSGARPLYLSAGFILEEGLDMTLLWRVVQSMQQAAQQAGVQIVTGDTKVVDRGKGDGIFINTAGIGIIEHNQIIAPPSVAVGDQVLLSGDLGRHGIAIMAVREGLAFETTIESDSASVAPPVLELLNAGVTIHCLRDLTRGGLASALNEIASSAKVQIHITERAIPVREDVQGACEILGFDPLYVANEGRFIAFVPPHDLDKALGILQQFDPQATVIGSVTATASQTLGLVTLESGIGATRIVDMLSGEQLPRIC